MRSTGREETLRLVLFLAVSKPHRRGKGVHILVHPPPAYAHAVPLQVPPQLHHDRNPPTVHPPQPEGIRPLSSPLLSLYSFLPSRAPSCFSPITPTSLVSLPRRPTCLLRRIAFPSHPTPSRPTSLSTPCLQVIHIEWKRQQAVRVAVTPGVTYRVVAAAWGPGVQVPTKRDNAGGRLWES